MDLIKNMKNWQHKVLEAQEDTEPTNVKQPPVYYCFILQLYLPAPFA